MKLLISDANILIDLEEGQLVEKLFRLPYQFSIPDILFYEELSAQHNYLTDLGLHLGELNSASMIYAFELVQRVSGPSRNDCLALALAIQEKCPLLTGDRALRKTAESESVEVMGTIWIVEEMVRHQVLNIDEAITAYKNMRANARRLPWDLAFSSLEKLKSIT